MALLTLVGGCAGDDEPTPHRPELDAGSDEDGSDATDSSDDTDTPDDGSDTPDDGSDGPDAGADEGNDEESDDTDGDGGSDDSDVASCLGDTPSHPSHTELMTLTAPGVSVGLVRYHEPDGLGTSNGPVWLVDRFALEHGDTRVCVTDPKDIDYTPTRHYLADSGVFWAGEVAYLLAYSQGWTLFAAKGEQTLIPRTPLTIASCKVQGDEQAACRSVGP